MCCQTLHAYRCSVLENSRFILQVVWILAGVQFIFDTLRCEFLCLPAFGCDFLNCALMLHADFACAQQLAWLLPEQLLPFFFFFPPIKLDFFLSGNISSICWCAIPLCDFSTELWCNKILSFFFFRYWKKCHTLVDVVLYSQYFCVCISKATLFAFSGQRSAVKAPLISCCQCSLSLSLSTR